LPRSPNRPSVAGTSAPIFAQTAPKPRTPLWEAEAIRPFICTRELRRREKQQPDCDRLQTHYPTPLTSRLTKTKRPEDFFGFMDAILAEISADQEPHAILDNYCTRKRSDPWLEQALRKKTVSSSIRIRPENGTGTPLETAVVVLWRHRIEPYALSPAARGTAATTSPGGGRW
jgi:hypothetical protein